MLFGFTITYHAPSVTCGSAAAQTVTARRRVYGQQYLDNIFSKAPFSLCVPPLPSEADFKEIRLRNSFQGNEAI